MPITARRRDTPCRRRLAPTASSVTAIEAKYFRKARTGRVGASCTAAGDHLLHITGGQPAFRRLEDVLEPLS